MEKYIRLNDYKLFYVTESYIKFDKIGNVNRVLIVIKNNDEYFEITDTPSIYSESIISFSYFNEHYKLVK